MEHIKTPEEIKLDNTKTLMRRAFGNNALENDEVYEKALALWGRELQLDMVVEECGELIAALGRYNRGRTDCNPVAEEIADVLITVEQARLIIGRDLVDEIKKQKLKRLKERVEHCALHGNGDSR